MTGQMLDGVEPFVPDQDDVDDVVLYLLGGDKVDTGEFGPLGIAIFRGQQAPFQTSPHPHMPEVSLPVVHYNLPYATYTSNVGLDTHRRICGDGSRVSTFFAVTYVGEDQWQAKWAGQRIRDALRPRLTVAGRKTGKPLVDVSPRIWRDDDVMRPDGSPLYYGIDEYAVSTARTVGGS